MAAVAERHGIQRADDLYLAQAFRCSDLKRLRQLEAENARMKKLVAERDLTRLRDEGSRRKKW